MLIESWNRLFIQHPLMVLLVWRLSLSILSWLRDLVWWCSMAWPGFCRWVKLLVHWNQIIPISQSWLLTLLAIRNQRETICPWLQTSGHISWTSYFLYNEVDEVEQSYMHSGEFCNYLIACVSKVCTLCTALKAKLLFGEVLQGFYVVFNFSITKSWKRALCCMHT